MVRRMTSDDLRSGGRASAAAAIGTASAGVGAAVTAAVAGACCTGPVIAPLVVGLLGAAGASAAASLKPYTPYLFAMSLLALAFGFHSAYRSRAACALQTASRPVRITFALSRMALWAAAVIWVAALTFTLYATHAV